MYSRTYSLASGGTLTISIEGDTDPFLFAEGVDCQLIENLLRPLDDYRARYFPEEVPEVSE
jgi:hypothetical protein